MRYPTRRVERIVHPAVEPVSTSQAKSFLRIDSSTEDSLIDDMIKTARIVAEQETGQSFVTQNWRISYNDSTPDCVPLPHGPVQSITSVKSIAEDGGVTTIAATAYHIDAGGATLVMESAPNGFRIEIDYVAGYGSSAASVPIDIVQAILLHVAHLYEHRDSIMPPTFSMLVYARQREVRL